MWQRLGKTNWPEGYYWIRKGSELYVAMFELGRMMFPGTSLRTVSKHDYDISEWEFFDKKIEEPTVNIQGFLPFPL